MEFDPKTTTDADIKATLFCELCGDERLEEDLNEDLLCPLCEERAEGSE